MIIWFLRLVGRFGSRKPVKHTSWVAIVTPTDRPKSVHNRCVSQVLVAFFVVTLLFGFFCRCRGFCHRTESDLYLFHFLRIAIYVYGRKVNISRYYGGIGRVKSGQIVLNRGLVFTSRG